MTLSVPVRNPVSGGASDSSAASVELPAEIFDARTNVSLLHQVVVAQLAAARQGTHKTKTRGEVSGGGAKPYRQKGTGRARQGSTRAPQFTGGGTVHGPQPRNYEQRTPKKMKAAALRGALSDRARNGCVYVVSAFVDGTPSTRAAAAALAGISSAKHVLVVAERGDEGTWKSLRNVDSVHLIEPGQLNTYDVLVSDDVVFTQAALDAFIAGPIGRKAKASVTQAPPIALDSPAQSPAFLASDASDADVLASSDAAVPQAGPVADLPVADLPVAVDAEAPGGSALEGDEG